jgi:hypothetical protein
VTDGQDAIPFTLDPVELFDALCDLQGEGYTLDDLRTALLLVGRNSTPRVLMDVYLNTSIPDDRWLQILVPDAWAMCEFPLSALDRDEWRILFDAAGYTIDGVRRPRPRKPRRLYRGAAEEYRDRWSWTEDRAVAGRFADRYQSVWHGRVWTVVAPPDRVLAKFTGRSEVCGREAEWVVDVTGLDITLADDAR